MNLLQKLKRRNHFLIIRVRAKELRIPVIIPVPLGIVEDLLESITQLYRISKIFVPRSSGKKHKVRVAKVSFDWHYLDAGRYLDLTHEMIEELRRQGRLTLVEVRDKDAHVSIKLY